MRENIENGSQDLTEGLTPLVWHRRGESSQVSLGETNKIEISNVDGGIKAFGHRKPSDIDPVLSGHALHVQQMKSQFQ